MTGGDFPILLTSQSPLVTLPYSHTHVYTDGRDCQAIWQTHDVSMLGHSVTHTLTAIKNNLFSILPEPEDQRIEPPTFWSVNNPLYLLSHSCHKYDSCGDKCGKNKKCSNTKRQSCSPETCVHLNKIQFSALHLEFCPVLDENENLFLFGRWSMTFLLGSEGEGKFKKSLFSTVKNVKT